MSSSTARAVCPSASAVVGADALGHTAPTDEDTISIVYVR